MSPSPAPAPLPEHSLLQRYARSGDYTDCYSVDVPRAVTQAQYVAAFYTTRLFKLERLILSIALRRPATDAQAAALAAGTLDTFSAWRVTDRAPDQLLMRDEFTRRTSSWLMAQPISGGTRLYFGSAVVPAPGATKKGLGFSFSALLGFHKAYSWLLLRAAARRLIKT